MTFRPENGERGGASGRPPGEPPDERLPAQLREQAEERRRRRSIIRPRLVPVAGGLLLLLVLLVGGIILWFSYGDRAGGASVYEDTIDSGAEPVIHLTNGPGRVRVEGVDGLENVEISAKRYARGHNPTAAKENASDVPINISNETSTLEISSDGGTGVDYDLRVPPGTTLEIDAEAGDVDVSGLDSGVTVRAQSGDVSVEDVQDSINIEAPQGDVTAKSVSTETGNAEITVGSGDLELENIHLGILEARVQTGDATLSGRFSGSGRVLVETGSISVQLPSEDTNDLTFETRVGEVVRQDEQDSG